MPIRLGVGLFLRRKSAGGDLPAETLAAAGQGGGGGGAGRTVTPR